jgi:hypothetical protein
MYISTFYVHASSFCGKSTLFVSYVKRQKNVPCKAYFSSKNCLFYTEHKKYRFLVKQFCENIECRDLHVKFLLEIFNISNFV